MLKRRYNILLVEDNRAIADLLTEALVRSGHAVTVAYNGTAANDILTAPERPLFHVAVIDYRLPDTDGIQVAGRVTGIFPAAKVVIISGYPDPVRQAIDTRGLPWKLMPKPFPASDLLQEIQNVMA